MITDRQCGSRGERSNCVDKEYLERTIALLRQERARHPIKFAGHAVHEGCLPRFDEAIRRLEEELRKLAESQVGQEQ